MDDDDVSDSFISFIKADAKKAIEKIKEWIRKKKKRRKKVDR